jgi:hypothetical protein
MAWVKLDSADGTGSASFDTGTFTANTFLTFMSYIERSADATNTEFRMGNNTIDSSGTDGTDGNYARRRNADYNTTNPRDDVTIDQNGINLRTAGTNECFFGHIVNISTEEKLIIMHQCAQGSTGADTAPYSGEFVAKWVNTSNQANILGFYSGGSNTLSSTSNLSVIGSDGVESMTIQDGAVYYDTDLNKEYVLYNNTWTEL